MAFYDNLGDFFNTAKGAVGLAGAGFDLYSGIKSYGQAQKMYDLAYGTAEQQDKYAREQLARQKSLYYPIEDIQARRALEDIRATEGLHSTQRQYMIDRGLADIAEQRALDPMFRATERSVLEQLTQTPEALASRYRAEGTSDIQRAFGQTADQSRRAMAAAGINPASGAYAAQQGQRDIQQALALAGTRTAATRQAEEQALSRQQQALNVRRGAQFQPQAAPTFNQAALAQGLAGATSAGLSAAQAAALNSQAGLSGATYGFNQALESLGAQRTQTGGGYTPSTYGVQRDQAIRSGLGTGR